MTNKNTTDEPSSNGIVHTRFVVVGLVRDCAETVRADVLRLRSAIGEAEVLRWLLIESDSADATIGVLSELSKEIDGFRYLSLGKLRTERPVRTDRIAHCRNAYVKELRCDPIYRDVDYVIVSDFDGLNTHISRAAIESCWSRSDWDMCAANQNGPYYDIWALRHDEWSPNDCWAQYGFLNKYSAKTRRNLYSSVTSRMITLPLSSDWIRVDSAFGGLAIYKKVVLEMGEYVGLTAKGEAVCEHVHFHNKLRQRGARLFINPKLINAEYTDYTEHLRFWTSLVIKVRSIQRKIVTALRGESAC